jgi:hypothetical protein
VPISSSRWKVFSAGRRNDIGVFQWNFWTPCSSRLGLMQERLGKRQYLKRYFWPDTGKISSTGAKKQGRWHDGGLK